MNEAPDREDGGGDAEDGTVAVVQEPDPGLLAILVCPLTKGALHYDRSRQELISVQASLAYPVRDAIPILVEDEARELTEQEIEHFRLRGR